MVLAEHAHSAVQFQAIYTVMIAKKDTFWIQTVFANHVMMDARYVTLLMIVLFAMKVNFSLSFPIL